ncbi:MAG: amidohydrolase family protein [Candidatus Polarisedimenticolia bacterium]
MRFRLSLACAFLIAGIVAGDVGAAPRRAVIDVHLHAGPAGWSGPGEPNEAENEKHLREALAAMDSHGVRLAVISGPMQFVEYWQKKAPNRFMASVMLPCEGGVAPLGGRQCFSSGSVFPDLAWLRSSYASGALAAMREITAQYAGLSPADPLLEPYFALAEELDIPVGVHTGLSYPGTPYQCCPKFRAGLGRPLLMEDVLVRHPKLRIYAMHGGSPYAEEMLAMMLLYPQLHIDISAINYLMPRSQFHAYVRHLVENGMGKRILFGTDDFPLGDCVDSIESAEFLSEEQKVDILCSNAARFFRLDDERLCKRPGV